MNTHISKELAVWLKRHGCEIYSPCKWVVDSKTKEYKMVDDNGPREENVNYIACGFDGADESRPWLEKGYGEMFYAYSWYDILVTHAKEFWGEKEVNNQNNTWRVTAKKLHTENILALLQENKIQETEDYVRKHSLFPATAE